MLHPDFSGHFQSFSQFNCDLQQLLQILQQLLQSLLQLLHTRVPLVGVTPRTARSQTDMRPVTEGHSPGSQIETGIPILIPFEVSVLLI